MDKHTPTPYKAIGNRLYCQDESGAWSDEVLVATKSSPRVRKHAEATAAFAERAVNSHDALVASAGKAEELLSAICAKAREVGLVMDGSSEQDVLDELCAALKLAKGE